MSKSENKFPCIYGNQVPDDIYDRIRVLIEEFGRQSYIKDRIYSRTIDEQIYYIENKDDIQLEIDHFEFIDEDVRDLLSEIQRRRKHLFEVKRFTEQHIEIDGVVYTDWDGAYKNETPLNKIQFSDYNDDYGFFATIKYSDIETKEVFYKVRLSGAKIENSTSKHEVYLEGFYERNCINKLIKYYVIDKSFQIDKDSGTPEWQRDFKIRMLTEID